MKNIILNDVLNLNDEELDNAKVVLNIGNPKYGRRSIYYDLWNETKAVSYSYWSHYGDNDYNQKSFKVGQRVFGFVGMKDDTYLLVTVGDIIEVPEQPGYCKYIKVERYDDILGRLVIEVYKNNIIGSYIFNIKDYASEIKALEILPVQKTFD